MEAQFDPNAAAQAGSGVFGLPEDAEHAQIVLIPVPWEATVSYREGAAVGPETILEASRQVDLCHHDFPDLWRQGIYMDELPIPLLELGMHARTAAEMIIESLEEGEDLRSPQAMSEAYELVNTRCETMVQWVKERVAYWRAQGKKVGLVGGDHSTPLGFLQWQAEQQDDFGLLVIDAHMDLRAAYEGFTYSHASIFYNALETLPQISRCVQVGIRDYCHEEKEYVQQHSDRLQIYYDRDLRSRQYRGETWAQLCDEIVRALPQRVYISVDIDGLDPKLCPNTGTPVPGGLQFEELAYLLNTLKASGKTVIGFDLCEVASGEDDEWDGNVGARVLYHLCGML